MPLTTMKMYRRLTLEEFLSEPASYDIAFSEDESEEEECEGIYAYRGNTSSNHAATEALDTRRYICRERPADDLATADFDEEDMVQEGLTGL